MIRRIAVLVTFLIALITMGAFSISPRVEGQGGTLDMSASPSDIVINVTQEMANKSDSSFYIERDITIMVTGDLQDPANPKLNATAYVQFDTAIGVIAMVTDPSPYKSGRLPFSTVIKLGIYKSSPVGDGTVEFVTRANDVVRSVVIPVKIIKEGLSVKLDNPTENAVMGHPIIRFSGGVSPPVKNAEVCLEIYHKVPDFSTFEKQTGQGSGIYAAGFTLTDERGRFYVEENWFTFYNPMGLLANNKMVNLAGLPDGDYWLMYYVTGRVLDTSLIVVNLSNTTNIEMGEASEIYQPTVTPDPTTQIYTGQLVHFVVKTSSYLTIIVYDPDGRLDTYNTVYINSTSQPSGQIHFSGSTSNGVDEFFEMLPGQYTFVAKKVVRSSPVDIWYEATGSVNLAPGQHGELRLFLKERPVKVENWRDKIPGFPTESIIIGVAVISLLLFRGSKHLKRSGDILSE